MGFERSPEITYEVIDERAMLLDAARTEILTLNPVGTLVWECLDGERDATDLADQLLPRFDGVGREELERDIAGFLAELSSLGLVVARATS